MSLADQQIELPSLAIPPGWLIAPRSYLVDRIVPDCERVWLPASQTGGGQVRLSIGVQPFVRPPTGGMKSRLRRVRNQTLPYTPKAPIVDLRAGHPENWAHFLNIHLAFVALVAQELDCSPQSFCLLLPQHTPTFIQDLAKLLDLHCLYTDDTVTGFGAALEFDTWNVIRGARAVLLTNPRFSPVATALQSGQIPPAETSEKLFLSRKTTRALTNEADVAQMLNARGFQTLYMENLSPQMQVRALVNARQIVAVHGAALAPLLYRDATIPPIDLVELFPVGHLTNVYRAVVAAQNGRWCGVRGYVSARNLPEIYRLEQPYLKHSLDPFKIDLAALELALTFDPAVVVTEGS